MLDAMSKLTQDSVIQKSLITQEALTRKNSDLRPHVILRIPVALDVAATDQNPYIVEGPFNGFYVETSTDSLTNVQMALVSVDQYNTLNYVTVYQKDSASLNEPISKAILKWPAQAGKSIVFVFFLGLEFKSGSYLSAINGAIYENYGTAMSPGSKVSVGTTATAIDTAQGSAKRRTIQVLDGAGIYLSGQNTLTGAAGSKPGIFVGVGGTYEWTNTGAIFGITDGGTSNISINTES